MRRFHEFVVIVLNFLLMNPNVIISCFIHAFYLQCLRRVCLSRVLRAKSAVVGHNSIYIRNSPVTRTRQHDSPRTIEKRPPKRL